MPFKPLTIGVNARFLTKPYTGIGQYTRHLFWSLAQQYPNLHIVMVTPETINYDHPSNIEIVVLPESFYGSTGMKKSYWERVQLTRFFKKRQVDIIHHPYPALFSPKNSKPIVVTVHDDIPWTRAEYRHSFLTRLYQDSVRNTVRKATKVITVSKASQHDIAQACRIPVQDIQVIPIAPAPVFFKAHDTAKNPPTRSNILDLIRDPLKFLLKDKPAVWKNTYGIPTTMPYLLYSGGYDVRKNVGTLIKVFAEKIAPFYKINLVLIGGKVLDNPLCESYNEALRIQKKLMDTHTKGQIITPGFIPEDDLPMLYQHAYLFVNFSYHEGFNLPLVEAAASGTVMLVSDLPVHHEVMGEYALYSDPHDPKDIAEKLTALMDKSLLWHENKTKISSYTSPFSWQKSAKKMHEVYMASLL